MEPEQQPLDPVAVACLVTRAIEAIDESTEEQRDALLSTFLLNAWGNDSSLNQ